MILYEFYRFLNYTYVILSKRFYYTPPDYILQVIGV